MSDIDLRPEIHRAATEVVRDLSGRRSYAHVAACVLGAVAPLIEAAVREQIARSAEAEANRLDPPEADWPDGGVTDAFTASGLRLAARIARGES